MRKKHFNLIEVTLAMGIGVIAVIILTGMLPVAMKNSRDAITTDTTTNMLNSFADYIVNEIDSATLFSYEKANTLRGASQLPDPKDYNTLALSQVFFGTDFFPHKSNDQLFKIEKNNPTNVKLIEIQAEVRIWTSSPLFQSSMTNESLGFSSRQTGRDGFEISNKEWDGTANNLTSNSAIKTLFVEASWPMDESDYSKRKKVTIIRDISEK